MAMTSAPSTAGLYAAVAKLLEEMREQNVEPHVGIFRAWRVVDVTRGEARYE